MSVQPRARLLAVTVAVGLGLAGCSTDPVTAPTARPSQTVAAALHPSVAPSGSRWARVLGRLDALRSAAYAASAPADLRRVYLPGSAVGRHDRRMLRAYVERDVTLSDVRLELLAVHLLERDRARVRLGVVDRLATATAHTSTGATVLPQDQPTRRIVVLRRCDGGWRVATVRRLAG